MMILCFQPNEAHISGVAIGAQGIGVVSEYYHRFICLGRWNNGEMVELVDTHIRGVRFSPRLKHSSMDMQTCNAGSNPALSTVFIAQRLERLTVVQEVGVQFPLNTNFFLIVCGCRGVVKRSISKHLRSSIGRTSVSKTSD